MHVYKYVRVYVCTYVRMYVCTYVRMYAYRYVFICVYLYMHKQGNLDNCSVRTIGLYSFNFIFSITVVSPNFKPFLSK